MFNSTHTLVGFALARVGLDRWAPHAVWTAVIASNLPDIDIATEFHNTATYIAYHRGITHTVVGVPLLSLALAGVMHAISRKLLAPFVDRADRDDVPSRAGLHEYVWVSPMAAVELELALRRHSLCHRSFSRRDAAWRTPAWRLAETKTTVGGRGNGRTAGLHRRALSTAEYRLKAGWRCSPKLSQALNVRRSRRSRSIRSAGQALWRLAEAVTTGPGQRISRCRAELARLEKSETTPEIAAAEASRTGSIFLDSPDFRLPDFIPDRKDTWCS